MNPARIRPLFALAVAVLAWGALPAQAQTCAGFTDVPAADPLCADIAWIRNRAITLGCGTGLYCPDDGVPRREMAAFVARLGRVLEPVVLRSADAATPAAVDLTGPLFTNVICQTPAYTVASFPRRASFRGFVSGNAAGDQTVIVDIVASFDNGTTWQLTRNAISGTTFPASGAASIAVAGDIDLAVGDTVRFAIAPTASLVQNAPSLSAYCGLEVEVASRTGASPPFDARAPLVDPAARAAGAFRR